MSLPATPFSETPPATPSRTTENAAFAILVREHHRGLLVYARALSGDADTAADLVQEAFLTAWRGLGDFDRSRDFGAWVRGITRNKWREHCRKHRREVDVDDETLARWEEQMAALDQSRLSGRGTVFEALDDCLRRLPEAMAEVVQRCYFRDEDGGESATALGIDAATLRKRLQRSREALRQCLDRKLAAAS